MTTATWSAGSSDWGRFAAGLGRIGEDFENAVHAMDEEGGTGEVGAGMGSRRAVSIPGERLIWRSPQLNASFSYVPP